MRSSSSFAVLALEACLATASYIEFKDGLIFKGLTEAALHERDTSDVPSSEIPRPVLNRCLFSVNIDPSTIGIGADPRFDWDDYCTALLAAPAATVTKTVSKTSAVTSTVGVTTTIATGVTTTLPGTPAGTITALCPIASAGQTCGVKGWGYAENNIYTNTSIDGPTCHQLCLKTANCASFQVQDPASDPSPQCNLYSVNSSANNTIAGSTSPFTFYDRDCPDLSPGCTTPKRDLAAINAARDTSARAPPAWFSSLPASQQYSICACIEGQDPDDAPPSKTKTVTIGVATTVLVSKPATVIHTTTATVGGGTGFVTSYSSVH